MVTATIPFQWTGRVLVSSRTQLVEALREPDANEPGIYLLVGETEERPTVYVGETDEIRTRIRQHSGAADKDWWETVIFVTATGEPLNKAHSRYLEYRIHQLAKEIGKVTVANQQTPTASPLSKASQAHMDDFLDNLRLVLPALRFDFLSERSKPKPPPRIDAVSRAPIYFTMEVHRHGIRARARLEPDTGDFIVEAGSVARHEWIGSTTAQSGYARLFGDLVAQGVLAESGDHRVYSRDYAFKSTSAAAAVTAGRPATGPGSWVLEGTDKTYGEWEQDSLAET